MVYYFHSTYTHHPSTFKYLVETYPDYELYDGTPLRENDILVVAVYLNLSAMAEFANLADILQKDVRTYGSLYKERFQFIDLNIDNDAGPPTSVKRGGFILMGECGMKNYIWHTQVVSLLKLPQSKLLLYNSWETRDLYKCIFTLVLKGFTNWLNQFRVMQVIKIVVFSEFC